MSDPTSDPKQVCPVNHTKKVCPVAHDSEPPDTPDHILTESSKSHISQKVLTNTNDPNNPYHKIPGIEIPSTGRGNSESGNEWLNPSPHQLYNSLQRKNKPILYEDAISVASVHASVTKQTWDAILQYENLHKSKCKEPKLARFEGKDGDYSLKARFFNKFFGIPLPYDRHDWTVDRCGKEITYIIDYYAVPTSVGESETEVENKSSFDKYEAFIDDENTTFEYTIDARPNFKRLTNIFDRIRVSYKCWKNGQNWY